MTADLLQRAHLEARRTYLATQVDALRGQALGLWRRAQTVRNTGGDSLPLDHLALDAEEACYRLNRALLAIEGSVLSLRSRILQFSP